MKNLFLLRHAHSENNNINDFERILSQDGINKCKSVGEIIANQNIDAIFSSDSIRTKQTVENITPYIKGIPKVNYLHDLYRISAIKLEQFIEDLSHEYDNLLLVGHNPAISDLAINLCKTSINSSIYEEITKGFSPASLLLIRDNQLTSFWR